jgi:hypothetical protein
MRQAIRGSLVASTAWFCCTGQDLDGDPRLIS